MATNKVQYLGGSIYAGQGNPTFYNVFSGDDYDAPRTLVIVGVNQHYSGINLISQSDVTWAKCVYSLSSEDVYTEIWIASYLDANEIGDDVTVFFSGGPSVRHKAALLKFSGIGPDPLDKIASNADSAGNFESGQTSPVSSAAQAYVAAFGTYGQNNYGWTVDATSIPSSGWEVPLSEEDSYSSLAAAYYPEAAATEGTEGQQPRCHIYHPVSQYYSACIATFRSYTTYTYTGSGLARLGGSADRKIEFTEPRSFLARAHLYSPIESSFGAGAELKDVPQIIGGGLLRFGGDASEIAYKAKEFFLNAQLAKLTQLDLLASAYLIGCRYIAGGGVVRFGGSAECYIEYNKHFSTLGHLSEKINTVFDANAGLAKTAPGAFLASAELAYGFVGSGLLRFSGNAEEGTVTELTFGATANLQKTSPSSFAALANLLKFSEDKDFLASAYLSASTSSAILANARLSARALQAFIAQAMLLETTQAAFAAYAKLISLDSYTGSGGASFGGGAEYQVTTPKTFSATATLIFLETTSFTCLARLLYHHRGHGVLRFGGSAGHEADISSWRGRGGFHLKGSAVSNRSTFRDFSALAQLSSHVFASFSASASLGSITQDAFGAQAFLSPVPGYTEGNFGASAGLLKRTPTGFLATAKLVTPANIILNYFPASWASPVLNYFFQRLFFASAKLSASVSCSFETRGMLSKTASGVFACSALIEERPKSFGAIATLIKAKTGSGLVEFSGSASTYGPFVSYILASAELGIYKEPINVDMCIQVRRRKPLRSIIKD